MVLLLTVTMAVAGVSLLLVLDRALRLPAQPWWEHALMATAVIAVGFTLPAFAAILGFNIPRQAIMFAAVLTAILLSTKLYH